MSPVTKVVENDGEDEGGVAGVLANRDSSSDLIFSGRCTGASLAGVMESWLFMHGLGSREYLCMAVVYSVLFLL